MSTPTLSRPINQTESALAGYEVIVGVAGGIAAYKVCSVVSGLVQRQAGVTVAMTESATRFVGPLTFQTLSARPVLTSLWTAETAHDAQHIHLTETADLFLVAPATANLIGKIAAGIADDLVSTLVLSTACPVVLAPSMNTRMFENPIVQRNIRQLEELGYEMIAPESGWLACRTVGAGRLAEPDRIVNTLVSHLTRQAPKREGAEHTDPHRSASTPTPPRSPSR